MKFVIVAHNPFLETNGGLMCLLNLAKMLHDRGQDSKIWILPTADSGFENNTVYPHYIQLDEMTDEHIAIYIDCILDNPLNAKRIVRYITYGSHWYPNYDLNEITYYHAPFCKNNPAKKILTPLHWQLGLENRGLQRTHAQCHILKKGWMNPAVRAAISDPNATPDPDSVGSIDLNGLSHQQIIEVFNTTRQFYCFDPCTFLVVMALMCGCVVIQFHIPGCSAEEWMYTIGLQGLNGIAYGDTPESRAHAYATIDKAQEDCMKLRRQNEESVDAFIRDMETGNYTTEPCYKFNDSPYSLQHLWKN